MASSAAAPGFEGVLPRKGSATPVQAGGMSARTLVWMTGDDSLPPGAERR